MSLAGIRARAGELVDRVRLRLRRPKLVAYGALLVVLAVFVLSTSRTPDARTLPPPSSTSSTDPASVTTIPDYSQIALERIPGETTSTTPIDEGDSTILGVVVGPDGPLPGAVVRIERLVGGVVQRTDIATGEDGRYRIEKVPGGRYRLRAFQAPRFAMQEPEIFFLTDGETGELALRVVEFEGYAAKAGTTPAAPFVGQPVNLAVLIVRQEVDADGIAREVPAPGVGVRVRSSGWTSLQDDDSGVTDNRGQLVLGFQCDRVGPVSASATIEVLRAPPATSAPAQPGPDAEPTPPATDQLTFPLEVPPCSPRPTTTTTTSTTTPGDEPPDDGDGEG